ncbi:hypothetical protein DAEQUDRAFT_729814, partial [Daedalea quercina L-15889]
MRPTLAHFGRFALLRDVAKSYKRQKGKKLSFWVQVDNRLKDIRAEVKAKYAQILWDQKISDKIAEILARDMEEFPVESGEHTKTAYTEDQLNSVQRAAIAQVKKFKTNDKIIVQEPPPNDGAHIPEEAAAAAATGTMALDMITGIQSA